MHSMFLDDGAALAVLGLPAAVLQPSRDEDPGTGGELKAAAGRHSRQLLQGSLPGHPPPAPGAEAAPLH
jgi:hypothetical protein